MKVFKFGGASVKDAAGVRNLCRIVAHTQGDLLVVVSAMGKTTNALERVVTALDSGDTVAARTEWNSLLDYHRTVIAGLGLQDAPGIDLPADIPFTPGASFDCNYDQIVSLGEIISTRIVTAYLSAQGIPAAWWYMPSLLRTDASYGEAQVDMETSARLVQAEWGSPRRPRVVVAQGFIGGTAAGLRTTLGREGSDYSAALLGNFLGAESVTIWKDVPGILNADPRLVKDTVLIPELSYNDAVELSYSGAQVIHPKTVRPLENKRIPLYVKPFGDPDAAGSVIHAEARGPIGVPVYIWRKNQVLITMRAKDFSFVLEESLSHIFDVIREHRLRVSLIQSSAVTISVCVDSSRRLQEAMECLSARYRLTYNDRLSLLTIRGTTPEILQREKAGRTVLLSQTTRRTARLVIKEEEPET